MQRLTITDPLGETLLCLTYDDMHDVAAIERQARREAAAHARHDGRVIWKITDTAGREVAVGEVTADVPAGLLAANTPVIYCESAEDAMALSAYGSIRGVVGGCYVVVVDHIDSGGRPVPFGVPVEFRVPLDTPPAGAPRTLAPLVMADAVAAQ